MTAERRHRPRERAGTRAQVDDDGIGTETTRPQPVDILGRVEPGLALVAAHVFLVEVFRPGVGVLVEPPVLHTSS